MASLDKSEKLQAEKCLDYEYAAIELDPELNQRRYGRSVDLNKWSTVKSTYQILTKQLAPVPSSQTGTFSTSYWAVPWTDKS